MSIKSKLLLLLIVIGSGTAFGQPTASTLVINTCSVVLSCPEYDFYAEKLVRYHGLVKDTASLGVVIKAQSVIIDQQTQTIREDSVSSKAKDGIVISYRDALSKKQAQFEKEQKKSNRRGILALVFGSATALALIVIVIALL